MPSQKQLKWSQLKVGIVVVVASLTLATLIVLMSGGGMFTSKIILKSYFPDASGLAIGAPVRLSGVDIGSVKASPRSSRQTTRSRRSHDESHQQI